MEKALVLFSGGQDSTICLIQAIRKYSKENVEAITFDYNSELKQEMIYAKHICTELGVKQNIFDAGIMHQVASNNVVEGRNLLLITLSAMYAMSKGIKNIIFGPTNTAHRLHPDTCQEFVKLANQTINVGMGYSFNIITPLKDLNKKEIWQLSDELGYLEFIRDKTYSCWTNLKEPCMECLSCKSRNAGYEEYMKYKAERGI